jgi:hypothetical protein
MSERASTQRRFELSEECLGRGHMVTLRFASARESGVSTRVEAQIAVWANEGGAGGDVRR